MRHEELRSKIRNILSDYHRRDDYSLANAESDIFAHFNVDLTPVEIEAGEKNSAEEISTGLSNIIVSIQCDIDFNEKIDIGLILDGLTVILDQFEEYAHQSVPNVSDEEIEKEATKYSDVNGNIGLVGKLGFITGAKWMRSQLQGKETVTDEEIEKEAVKRAITNTDLIREPERAWFEKGAKWLRSQLQSHPDKESQTEKRVNAIGDCKYYLTQSNECTQPNIPCNECIGMGCGYFTLPDLTPVKEQTETRREELREELISFYTSVENKFLDYPIHHDIIEKLVDEYLSRIVESEIITPEKSQEKERPIQEVFIRDQAMSMIKLRKK